MRHFDLKGGSDDGEAPQTIRLVRGVSYKGEIHEPGKVVTWPSGFVRILHPSKYVALTPEEIEELGDEQEEGGDEKERAEEFLARKAEEVIADLAPPVDETEDEWTVEALTLLKQLESDRDKPRVTVLKALEEALTRVATPKDEE